MNMYIRILIFLVFLLPITGFAGNIAPSADNSTSYNDRDLNTAEGGTANNNFYLTWGTREFAIDTVTFKQTASAIGNYRARVGQIKIEFGGSGYSQNPPSPVIANVAYNNTGQFDVTLGLEKAIFCKWMRITPLSWYPHQSMVPTTTWQGNSSLETTTFYEMKEVELGGTLPMRYQVQKSLNWLGRTAVAWTRGENPGHYQTCNGCHVQSQAIIGLSEGFNNNYDISADYDRPNEDPSIPDLEDLAFFIIRCQNLSGGMVGYPTAEIPYGPDANIYIEQNGNKSKVNPFKTAENGISFYDMSSDSCHKWAKAYESHILLHKDTRNNEFSFIFSHNVDADNFTDNKIMTDGPGASGNSSDPKVVTSTSIAGVGSGEGKVQFSIDWGGASARIDFSDDPGEVPTGQTALAKWHFGQNTDGGVIWLGSNAQNLNIKITPILWWGIMDNQGAANKWRIIGADDSGGPYHGDYTKNPVPPTTVNLDRSAPIYIKGGAYPLGLYFRQGSHATMFNDLDGRNDTSYPRTISMFAAQAIVPFAQYYAKKKGGTMVKGTQAEVDTFLTKMAGYVLSIQDGDGSWYGDHNTYGGGFSDGGDRTRTTAIFVQLLSWFVAENLGTAAQRATAQTQINKSLVWLKASNPTLTQDAAFAVLGLIWGQESNLNAISSKVTKLISMRANNRAAWGISPGDTPNPYSTGEAIFALKKAGFSPDQSIDKNGNNPPDFKFKDALDDLFAQQDTAAEQNAGYWDFGSHTKFAGTMYAATALGAAISLTEVKWLFPGLPEANQTYPEVVIPDREDLAKNLKLQVDVVSNTGDLVEKVEFLAVRLGSGAPTPTLIGTSFSPGAPGANTTGLNTYNNTDGNARTFEIKYNARDLPNMTYNVDGTPKGGTYKFFARAYTDFPSVDEAIKIANVGVSEIDLPKDFMWAGNLMSTAGLLSLQEDTNYDSLGIRGTLREIVDSYKFFYVISRKDSEGNYQEFRNFTADPIKLPAGDSWAKFYSTPISFVMKDGGEYWVKLAYQYSVASTGLSVSKQIPASGAGYRFLVKQKTPENGSNFLKAGLSPQAPLIPLNEDTSNLAGSSYNNLTLRVTIDRLAYALKPGYDSANPGYGDSDTTVGDGTEIEVSDGAVLIEQEGNAAAGNGALLSTLWNTDTDLTLNWKVYRGDNGSDLSTLRDADLLSPYQGTYKVRLGDIAQAAGLTGSNRLIDLLKKRNIQLNFGTPFASPQISFQHFVSEKIPGGFKTPLERSADGGYYWTQVKFNFSAKTFQKVANDTRYSASKVNHFQDYSSPATGYAGTDYRRKIFIKDTTPLPISEFDFAPEPGLSDGFTGDSYKFNGAPNAGEFHVAWTMKDNNPYSAVQNDSTLVYQVCPTLFSLNPGDMAPVNKQIGFLNGPTVAVTPPLAPQTPPSNDQLINGSDELRKHVFSMNVPLFPAVGSALPGQVPDWLPPNTAFKMRANQHYIDLSDRNSSNAECGFTIKDNDPPSLNVKFATMRGQEYTFRVNEGGVSSRDRQGNVVAVADPVNDANPYDLNEGLTAFLVSGKYDANNKDPINAVENKLGRFLFNDQAILNYADGQGLKPDPAKPGEITLVLEKIAVGGNFLSPVAKFREDERIYFEVNFADNHEIIDWGMEIVKDGNPLNAAELSDNRALDSANGRRNPSFNDASMPNPKNKHQERRGGYLQFPDPFPAVGQTNYGTLRFFARDRSGNQTSLTLPFAVEDTQMEIRVLEQNRTSGSR